MADDDSTTEPAASQTLFSVGDTSNPDSQYPGRRLKNPLGFMASYTYNWTLYLVTPEVYAAWTVAGCRDVPNIGNGAYPIVASGGINNSNSVYTRAESIPFDYFIDTVDITTIAASNQAQGGPIGFEFKFRITEPMGFSFINNMKKLEREVEAKHGYKASFIKQQFLAEVKFYGWDMEGNLVKGSDVFDSSGEIDPASDGNSLFKRVFDVVIQGITFQLGTPKGTQYEMKFVITNRDVQGAKTGWVNKDITLSGITVDEDLQSLVKQLNEQEEKDVADGIKTYPNVYKISYVDAESAAIGAATKVNPDDLQKTRFPMPDIQNAAESTEAAAAQAAANNVRQPINRAGQSILFVIDDIIKNSSYMRELLTKLLANQTQPPPPVPGPGTGDFKTLDNDNQRKLSWYTVSVQLGTNSPARWDPKINDWAWNVEYKIIKMYTPVITAAYIGDQYTYFGPHKRYEYLFTGKNSDIISYNQNFNNLFYLIAFDKDGEGEFVAPDSAISKKVGQTQGDNQSGAGPGQQAQNAVLTSLYDPSTYATAKMRVLGDPDFLCAMPQVTAGSSSIGDTVTGVYNHFYHDVAGGDKFQINPQGSEVCVEVDFKEGVDYQQDGDGLLSINTSIQFWEYPEDIANIIKGVAYKVIRVQHNFSAGKYEMEMSMIPIVFPKGGVLKVVNEQGEITDAPPADGGGEGEAAAAGDTEA